MRTTPSNSSYYRHLSIPNRQAYRYNILDLKISFMYFEFEFATEFVSDLWLIILSKHQMDRKLHFRTCIVKLPRFQSLVNIPSENLLYRLLSFFVKNKILRKKE